MRVGTVNVVECLSDCRWDLEHVKSEQKCATIHDDAPDFVGGLLWVCDVIKNIPAENYVKGVVGEWQRLARSREYRRRQFGENVVDLPRNRVNRHRRFGGVKLMNYPCPTTDRKDVLGFEIVERSAIYAKDVLNGCFRRGSPRCVSWAASAFCARFHRLEFMKTDANGIAINPAVR